MKIIDDEISWEMNVRMEQQADNYVNVYEGLI